MAGVQILSHTLVKGMDSNKKLDKIFSIVRKGDIVMLEGRLTPDEETVLISKALRSVSGKFSGIEIASLDGSESQSFMQKIKLTLTKIVAGDRFGLTVIGPSKLIKEIKMNPEKLEILFK